MTNRKDFSGWFFRGRYVLQLKFRLKYWRPVYRLYCRMKGVEVGHHTSFNGFPRIFRAPGSRIALGNNCIFNSGKNAVEIGLVKKCAFVTMEPDAEIIIGNNTGASGATIVSCSRVSIGDHVVIGAYCTITDTDFHNPDPDKREIDVPTRPVVIGNNVFLGMNAMILKGVTIGENAVIGANSVVMSDIPPNAIAMGNPCKVILIRNWGETDG